MKTITIACVVILLLAAQVSFGMAGAYLEGPVYGADQWPKGLADLLNSQPRVYAYWFNESDYLYYSGDTAAFQKFLDSYAKIQDISLTLNIQPGKGTAKTLDGKPISYDWSVYGAYWGLDRSISIEKPAPVVALTLWTDGKIDRTKLKIPKGVSVVETPTAATSTSTSTLETGIYLLEGWMPVGAAAKADINSLKLQAKPYISINDIASYRWSDHTITLTCKRELSPNNVGICFPFVMVAGGKRLYVGMFIHPISSEAYPGVPMIGFDYTNTDQLRIGICDYGWAPGSTKTYVDPRSAQELKAALEAAGKLKKE